MHAGELLALVGSLSAPGSVCSYLFRLSVSQTCRTRQPLSSGCTCRTCCSRRSCTIFVQQFSWLSFAHFFIKITLANDDHTMTMATRHCCRRPSDVATSLESNRNTLAPLVAQRRRVDLTIKLTITLTLYFSIMLIRTVKISPSSTCITITQ